MLASSERRGLVRELCRVFNAKPVAIECMLHHGQVLVDGFIMRIEHDQRWTAAELKGRMAAIHYFGENAPPRQARLYA